MTTAYIVETKFGDNVNYMIAGGRFSHFPKLFTGHARVKTLLSANGLGYGNSRFCAKMHKDSTKIIRIQNLERGMRDSHATIFTYEEFMARDFSRNGLTIPNNPNAIYMIELAQNLELATKAKPQYVQTAGQGRRCKFGHQWNSGGHVRLHITGRLHRLESTYKGAKVLEIEMHEDGFTPKQVKSYPIVDFYCASKSSREQYNQKFRNKPYTPTSPEYA